MAKTVLIVDDSAVMRKVVERALGQTELVFDQVLHAANGLEALDLLREQREQGLRVDLILSDINMPVMDGLTFAEHVREEKLMPEAPLLMITTEATEASVRRALLAGASGYLLKPFTPEQLADVGSKLATQERR